MTIPDPCPHDRPWDSPNRPYIPYIPYIPPAPNTGVYQWERWFNTKPIDELRNRIKELEAELEKERRSRRRWRQGDPAFIAVTVEHVIDGDETVIVAVKDVDGNGFHIELPEDDLLDESFGVRDVKTAEQKENNE